MAADAPGGGLALLFSAMQENGIVSPTPARQPSSRRDPPQNDDFVPRAAKRQRVGGQRGTSWSPSDAVANRASGDAPAQDGVETPTSAGGGGRRRAPRRTGRAAGAKAERATGRSPASTGSARRGSSAGSTTSGRARARAGGRKPVGRPSNCPNPRHSLGCIDGPHCKCPSFAPFCNHSPGGCTSTQNVKWRKFCNACLAGKRNFKKLAASGAVANAGRGAVAPRAVDPQRTATVTTRVRRPQPSHPPPPMPMMLAQTPSVAHMGAAGVFTPSSALHHGVSGPMPHMFAVQSHPAFAHHMGPRAPMHVQPVLPHGSFQPPRLEPRNPAPAARPAPAASPARDHNHGRAAVRARFGGSDEEPDGDSAASGASVDGASSTRSSGSSGSTRSRARLPGPGRPAACPNPQHTDGCTDGPHCKCPSFAPACTHGPGQCTSTQNVKWRKYCNACLAGKRRWAKHGRRVSASAPGMGGDVSPATSSDPEAEAADVDVTDSPPPPPQVVNEPPAASAASTASTAAAAAGAGAGADSAATTAPPASSAPANLSFARHLWRTSSVFQDSVLGSPNTRRRVMDAADALTMAAQPSFSPPSPQRGQRAQRKAQPTHTVVRRVSRASAGGMSPTFAPAPPKVEQPRLHQPLPRAASAAAIPMNANEARRLARITGHAPGGSNGPIPGDVLPTGVAVARHPHAGLSMRAGGAYAVPNRGAYAVPDRGAYAVPDRGSRRCPIASGARVPREAKPLRPAASPPAATHGSVQVSSSARTTLHGVVGAPAGGGDPGSDGAGGR